MLENTTAPQGARRTTTIINDESAWSAGGKLMADLRETVIGAAD